ncbi:MAG: hypothetical protein K0U41_05400 [Gammaproteobacteria bacterium]|nr:hypothetical protein [Gammaproteobacteria bacterium]
MVQINVQQLIEQVQILGQRFNIARDGEEVTISEGSQVDSDSQDDIAMIAFGLITENKNETNTGEVSILFIADTYKPVFGDRTLVGSYSYTLTTITPYIISGIEVAYETVWTF